MTTSRSMFQTRMTGVWNRDCAHCLSQCPPRFTSGQAFAKTDAARGACRLFLRMPAPQSVAVVEAVARSGYRPAESSRGEEANPDLVPLAPHQPAVAPNAAVS